jgi:hypothetical protein
LGRLAEYPGTHTLDQLHQSIRLFDLSGFDLNGLSEKYGIGRQGQRFVDSLRKIQKNSNQPYQTYQVNGDQATPSWMALNSALLA